MTADVTVIMKRKDDLKTIDINAVAQASGGYHHHYHPGWGARAFFGGYPYAAPYYAAPYYAAPYYAAPYYAAPYYAGPGVVVIR